MSERELFIGEIKKNQYFLNICKIKGIHPDEMLMLHADGEFKFSDARLAFEAWKTSANRQGYKFVPVDPSEEMCLAAYDKHGDYVGLADDIYKAMIGVVE